MYAGRRAFANFPSWRPRLDGCCGDCFPPPETVGTAAVPTFFHSAESTAKSAPILLQLRLRQAARIVDSWQPDLVLTIDAKGFAFRLLHRIRGTCHTLKQSLRPWPRVLIPHFFISSWGEQPAASRRVGCGPFAFTTWHLRSGPGRGV